MFLFSLGKLKISFFKEIGGVNEKKIIVLFKKYKIIIEGEFLKVLSYDENEMIVGGTFKNIKIEYA